MASVFISYGREDAAKVGSLADDIGGLGHQVWFDQDLTGGQAWWDHILKSIRQYDVFVFALSPASLDSPACKLEYTYAAQLRKSILPVLVAEGVSVELLPSSLAQLQYVDYRREDKNALKALAKALAGLPPPLPLPEPLPEPPAAPVSYLSSLSELIDAQRPLSFDEQTAVVLRLKHGLRDDSTNPELARALLRKLRSRDDLYAKVGEEIDDLLRALVSVLGPAAAPSRVAGPTLSPQVAGPEGPPVTSSAQDKSIKQPPGPSSKPAPPVVRALSGIAGPRDLFLAIIFGAVLQVVRNLIFGGMVLDIGHLVLVPFWALYGSIFLVAPAAWRRVRARPLAFRVVCLVWPLGGGLVSAIAVWQLESPAYGLDRYFMISLLDIGFLGALVVLSMVVVLLVRETTTKPVSLGQAIWVVTGGQVAAIVAAWVAWPPWGPTLQGIASFLAVSWVLGAGWLFIQRVSRRRVE